MSNVTVTIALTETPGRRLVSTAPVVVPAPGNHGTHSTGNVIGRWQMATAMAMAMLATTTSIDMATATST